MWAAPGRSCEQGADEGKIQDYVNVHMTDVEAVTPSGIVVSEVRTLQ